MSLPLSMYLEYALDTIPSSKARAVHISSIDMVWSSDYYENKSQVAYPLLNRKT